MAAVTHEDVMSIIENTGIDGDLKKIRAGSSLTDAGVDSLDLANVLLGIEEKYDIQIPDEDLDELISVKSIVQYLNARLLSQSSSSVQ